MKIRIRRNSRRDYTETQRADMRRADIKIVRARIFELGVSKFLKDGCGLDADATKLAAEILHSAASERFESEQIYTRIRHEADAAQHLEEPDSEAPTGLMPPAFR